MSYDAKCPEHAQDYLLSVWINCNYVVNNVKFLAQTDQFVL